MNQVNNKWVLSVMLTIGTFIGFVRGNEARQKWMFKMRNRNEQKRQLAENKKVLRSGGVALDDIEMAAFHN
jgi:hypothetical protein